MITTGRSLGPRRFAWLATACVASTIALDRAAVLAVDVLGARVAVPDGRYRDGDLTDRVGDGVDFALAAAVVVLGLWALWLSRSTGDRTGRLAASVAIAVTVTAGLIAAVFFTPLNYSLSPGASNGDDLTFGRAPGPYWYQIARPLLLGLAVLSVLAVVVRTATDRAAPEPPAAASAGAPVGAGRAVTVAAVVTLAAASLLLVLNVSVAWIAGISPAGTLLPLVALAPAAVLTIRVGATARRGTAGRRALSAIGIGILAPLWAGTAVWLVFTDPLVVEPSPVDDAARAGLEPWVAPSLLVLAALVVIAQVTWVVALTRRSRPGG